jgi:hypothetical protein
VNLLLKLLNINENINYYSILQRINKKKNILNFYNKDMRNVLKLLHINYKNINCYKIIASVGILGF